MRWTSTPLLSSTISSTSIIRVRPHILHCSLLRSVVVDALLFCRTLSHSTSPNLYIIALFLFISRTGFKKIEALEPYTGLKVLYLEGNGLDTIEGLAACTELKCLYLQENLIENVRYARKSLYNFKYSFMTYIYIFPRDFAMLCLDCVSYHFFSFLSCFCSRSLILCILWCASFFSSLSHNCCYRSPVLRR